MGKIGYSISLATSVNKLISDSIQTALVMGFTTLIGLLLGIKFTHFRRKSRKIQRQTPPKLEKNFLVAFRAERIEV